jgi:serine/threonine-protein kinase
MSLSISTDAMPHPLLEVTTIDTPPADYLGAAGRVFATFDARTQDSGNVSYGVQVGDARYFVKSAGCPEDPRPYLRHPERVALLRNAVRIARGCDHPALPRLHQVIESPAGPLLVYDWLEGELVGARQATRDDPRSAFQRFRALPALEILQALDVVYDLHRVLAASGRIAADFYDGCLIYDFARQELRLVDLDNYSEGPFTNTMGRMFGSTRFMAPEEFERGALIDERTTVFTMGRTAAVLLSDGTLEREPFRGSDALYAVVVRACRGDRGERYGSLAEFDAAWRDARRAG